MMIRPTVVNLKRDKYTLYIGRGSKWGNPYKIDKDNSREDVLKKYRVYISNKIDENPVTYDLSELLGQILGCYCKPLDCHGDILIQIMEEKGLIS